MKKQQKGGVAMLMYIVIAVTVVIAGTCFGLYCGGIKKHGAVLWTRIVAFVIVYHLWLRLIMGNVTKQFRND